jgi:uroporphyrinogen-III decarboxylase
MRNTRNFLTDLIRYQDKIKAVLDMSIDGFIEVAKRLILNPKLNLLPDHNFVEILCLSGGGGTSKGARRMYSPRIFETLYFPYLKKMVHELHKIGYRMILHLDASWTEVLPYFKEIPKGQLAWLETDGSTDLVKAKEILGGHHCVGGDVPATLLTSGSVKNVEDYVQHLIDDVASDGGFILTTGCEIPPDAKFENVRAMIQYAKDHGRYRD